MSVLVSVENASDTPISKVWEQPGIALNSTKIDGRLRFNE